MRFATPPKSGAPVPQDEPSAHGRRPRRRTVVSVAGLVALAIAGVTGATLAGNNAVAPPVLSSGVRGVTSTAASHRMPSLSGLDLVTAKRRLRDAGITSFTTQVRDSGRPEGTVIDQTPASGVMVAGGVMVVVATSPAAMPDVTGQQFSSAMNTLQGLGAQVTADQTIDETDTDGTVLAQDPKAGNAFATAVTLTVARQPVTVFLGDLQPVESTGGSSASSGLATINGTQYVHAVAFTCSNSCNLPSSAGYDAGGHYRRFRATVGLSDSSASGVRVKFEMLADGRSIYTATLARGQTAAVDVDITGALRLTLVETILSNLDPHVVPAFGDARILGLASEVPAANATHIR